MKKYNFVNLLFFNKIKKYKYKYILIDSLNK